MSKKPLATLSAGLVAVKGQAPAPAHDTTPRTPLMPVVEPAAESSQPERRAKALEPAQEPLNFRVTARFRRDFKTFAATHDMKLNELLQRCFEAYQGLEKN
jgi:hypothetical protein